MNLLPPTQQRSTAAHLKQLTDLSMGLHGTDRSIVLQQSSLQAESEALLRHAKLSKLRLAVEQLPRALVAAAAKKTPGKLLGWAVTHVIRNYDRFPLLWTVVQAARELAWAAAMPQQLEASFESAEDWQDKTGMESDVDWELRMESVDQWLQENWDALHELLASFLDGEADAAEGAQELYNIYVLGEVC